MYKELKFNLFSVSQMCDKKNSVLFTDTACVFLSPDFKLTDESQVLLKVPRKDNMYNVDLKNVVPQGGFTCLFAKATSDESTLWHRRLGHNGPTPHPQRTDSAPEGVPPPINKRDEEFTEEDNRNELEDIQAINILSQGLPRRSGQTLERRKEVLFDEFERFHANGNELIQDYFVHFHKLVNDIKVTQLDIPTHQLNTKFANNLPSYWGKYVTHAKNNMNMSTVTYVELFTHLRTYEEHALKSLKKKEQSSAIVDPLTYLAKTTPTHSTTSPVTVPTPQSSGDSHNDAILLLKRFRGELWVTRELRVFRLLGQ
nr:ribonuclease H-like domain-containing protein [Tanacetum cinerariifolium]